MPNSARTSRSWMRALQSLRSFKFASKASSSTVPSLPLAAALTSLRALETSCNARCEIAKTSWTPVKRPTPANVCRSVANNSSRLLEAIFRHSSTVVLPAVLKRPRWRLRISFDLASTCCLFWLMMVYSWVRCKCSCSTLSRWASSCNRLRRLEALKWLMSLSCVSRVRFSRAAEPFASPFFSSRLLANSVSAVSCWSQMVSSRPIRCNSLLLFSRNSSMTRRRSSELALSRLNSSSKFRISSSSKSSLSLPRPALSFESDFRWRVTDNSCAERDFSAAITDIRSSLTFDRDSVHANLSL
mmetsp:Transcript_15448/g.32549  ORF Transcript_15448/g.32549 Transcript_15448/m.32549 type:complete len:300 (+) Transcript_15448:251-1150(+)